MIAADRIPKDPEALAFLRRVIEAFVQPRKNAPAPVVSVDEGEVALLVALLARPASVLTAERARQLVDPEVYDRLRAREMIRVVLGAVEVPPRVRDAMRALAPDERTVIEVLIGERGSPDTLRLQVVETEVRALSDESVLDALVARHVVAFRNEQLVVSLGESLATTERACERLWAVLCDDARFVDDADRAIAWTRCVPERLSAVRALRGSQPAQVARFVDAAIAALLRESDLVGSEEELVRRIVEHTGTDAVGSGDAPQADDIATSCTRYAFWTRPAHASVGGDETIRLGVDQLLDCVVFLGDSAAVARLLDASGERPYLVEYIGHAIARQRPALLADLLHDPAHAALALRLLRDVPLDPGTSVQIGPSADIARRFAYLWDEALRAMTTITAYTPDAAAATMWLDALLVQPPPSGYQRSARETEDIEHRLHAAITSIGRGTWLIGAAHALVEQLIPRLRTGFSARVLQTGFWLLEQLARRGSTDTAPLADALAESYEAAIASRAPHWHHDHDEVGQLRWSLVLERILEPMRFLRPGLDDTTDLSDRDRASEAMTRRRRRRLHLRVLAEAHVALATERSNIEEAIESLIASDLASEPKWGRMLSLDAAYLDAKSELDLVDLLVRCIDSTSPALRNRVYERLLAAQLDAPTLARIAGGTAIDDVSRRCLDQLAEHLAADLPQTIFTWPLLADLAIHVLHAGRAELAARCLDIGDREPRDSLGATMWRDESTPARMALAVARGQPLPPDNRPDPIARAARTFYDGLIAMRDADPASAVVLFRRYLAERPDAAAAQVNLFAAELHVARPLPAQQRATLVRAALATWDAAAARLPALELRYVDATAAYNRLEALLTLGDVERAMGTLAELPSGIRFHPSIAALVLSLSDRQPGVAAYAADVRAFHGANIPQALDNALPAASLALAESPPTLSQLRALFPYLLRQPLHELGRIVSDAPSFDRFLAELHAQVLASIAEYGGAVRSMDHEDNYTMWLIHGLRPAVAWFGISITAQSQGGSSGGGAAWSRGERDWAFQRGPHLVALGEGLRSRDASLDKPETARHIKKLVSNYNPTITPALYIVVWIERMALSAYEREYRLLLETCEDSTVRADGFVERIPNAGGHCNPVVLRSRHRVAGVPVWLHHLLVALGPPAPTDQLGSS